MPDSRETKLGISNQEASGSEGKNSRVVLVPRHVWKCVPTAFSCGVHISEVAAYHLFCLTSFQGENIKDWCLIN